jgi:branched-chain amino acid transport system ATP-binding protein
MALMNEPTVLLLDEPTAGINPTLINGLIDRLKRANAEFGITMLIIEHNMRVIMNMASKIYCLAHGEMLAAGAPEEIQGNQNVVDAYLGRTDGKRRTHPLVRRRLSRRRRCHHFCRRGHPSGA